MAASQPLLDAASTKLDLFDAVVKDWIPVETAEKAWQQRLASLKFPDDDDQSITTTMAAAIKQQTPPQTPKRASSDPTPCPFGNAETVTPPPPSPHQRNVQGTPETACPLGMDVSDGEQEEEKGDEDEDEPMMTSDAEDHIEKEAIEYATQIKAQINTKKIANRQRKDVTNIGENIQQLYEAAIDDTSSVPSYLKDADLKHRTDTSPTRTQQIARRVRELVSPKLGTCTDKNESKGLIGTITKHGPRNIKVCPAAWERRKAARAREREHSTGRFNDLEVFETVNWGTWRKRNTEDEPSHKLNHLNTEVEDEVEEVEEEATSPIRKKKRRKMNPVP